MKQEPARQSTRGTDKLHISHLPFSAIPHQSRLFIEYLRDPVSLRSFYPNAVASPGDVAGLVPDVLSNYKTDRTALCDALTEINTDIDAGKYTFANIDLLRREGTVAVVTGQQAGLFSGPLYTVYKALSAISMAESLTSSGIPAVPVFWIATEDHDLDEVSKTFFTGKDGGLVASSYTPADYVKDAPVGNIAIDDGIAGVIAELGRSLPHTEFSEDVIGHLATSWAPGVTFGKAFAITLARVFEKYGLIFVDPLNDRLKRLAAPIYVEAIKNADAIVEAVIERSAEITSRGFQPQVLVGDDYSPLFWHDANGRRLALRKVSDDVYKPKGERREFTGAELAKIATDEPSRFSPGVMLRAVVQDFLFPTACYFGGAAEIAYFAQNSVVYERLGRPVTTILHRQSFTIVEARHRRSLEKLGLDLADLFDGLEATRLKLAESKLAPETAGVFTDVDDKIAAQLERLEQIVSAVDPTLMANLAKRRRKMLYHIAALRKKTLLAETRKDETIDRQLTGAVEALLPHGALQERLLNVFEYLNKFGPHFIDLIYEAIDLDDKDHRIVDL